MPSRESNHRERRGRRTGGWRLSLSRTDVRKNPQHLWVLQFGVGSRLRRLDTRQVCEDWRTLRNPWEKRATYPPSCLGNSLNTFKMVAAQVGREASSRQYGLVRTSKWLQGSSSRCIGGLLKQGLKQESKSMLVLFYYVTWWAGRLRMAKRRSWPWPWPWFLMFVFCEWRRLLACGLGMYVTAVIWFFGIVRQDMKGGRGGRYLLGSGHLLSGFTTGLRDEGAPGTTCSLLQGLLSSRKQWRTWYVGQHGPGIDGTVSGVEELQRAGRGDRPCLILNGGADGQQRRQQWRMHLGTEMKRLWPRFVCHRFGVPYQRQLSRIRNKCGETSCSMTGIRTKTGRCGAGASDAERRPVCSGVRDLQGSRDLMRQTWVAHRRTQDQECRPMMGRVRVRVCEGLQRLFQRQRQEGVHEQDTRWGSQMSLGGGLRVLPVHCPVGDRTPAMQQILGSNHHAMEESGQSSGSRHRRQDDRRRHRSRGPGGQPLNLPEGTEESSVRWVAEPFQYQQGGRVARRWRWRRLQRDARLPQGWRELGGDRDTAMESQDRDGSDPGLYPVEPAGQGGGLAHQGDQPLASTLRVPGILGGLGGDGG